MKCPLTVGSTIYWYYQEDKEFAEDCDFNIKDDPGFRGLIVPMPDIELHSPNADIESDDCIIIVTSYPVEKEYCQCGWISLHRLLDQDGLVEVFSKEKNE